MPRMTSTSAATQTFTFFLMSDLQRANDRSVPAQWSTPTTTASQPHGWKWR